MAIYGEHTDQELTALLKAGDAAAFSELFDRYNRLLFVHAFRIIGDEEQARDLVQDVFVALWDRHSELSTEGNLASFLYTTIRNKVFNAIEHRKVADKYLQSLKEAFARGEEKTDHLLRSRQLEAIIEREIANLPEHLRKTFELRRKGLSHKEIAEQQDISEKTARNQVSKSLKILRTKLGLLAYFYFLFNG